MLPWSFPFSIWTTLTHTHTHAGACTRTQTPRGTRLKLNGALKDNVVFHKQACVFELLCGSSGFSAQTLLPANADTHVSAALAILQNALVQGEVSLQGEEGAVSLCVFKFHSMRQPRRRV